MRGFINWGSIRLHKYFLIRERHGALELRIATLRSCGRKDSTVLNHEFLGVSDLMLTEAVAECEKSKKCAFRGDYGISEPIRKALEEACETGKL